MISAIAGGPGGPGLASTVAIGQPWAVTFHDGYLYLSDQVDGQNSLVDDEVRRISIRTGQLTNLVGADTFGFTANGGLALGGEIGSVTGVTADRAGNLLFSDGDIFDNYQGEGAQGSTGEAPGNVHGQNYGNNRVRVVAARTGTFYGRHMTAGHIYTIAGTGAFGYSGDGGPATTAKLYGPTGIAVDPAGNVIVADTGNNRIRVIAQQAGTFYGVPMTKGDIYTVAGGGTSYGDGGAATQAALDIDPDSGGGPVVPVSGVRIDHSGNLVITDTSHNTIRVIAAATGSFYGQAMTAGHIYTIAGTTSSGKQGNGIPAVNAALDNPDGLAIDSTGNVIISQSGALRLVAVQSGTFYGQHMTAGDIYTLKAPEAGTPSIDSAGNLITSGGELGDFGVIEVTAARSGHYYGQAMTAGQSYVITGLVSSTAHNQGPRFFSGGGGPATSATIAPGTVAPDPAGNLLIADGRDHRVLLVASRSGHADGKPVTAGHIYTVGGDGILRGGPPPDGVPATKVSLNPAGVATDHAGNIIVAQPNHFASTSAVLVIATRTGRYYGRRMISGDVYTVAGGGQSQASGVPATEAALGATCVVVDRWGNLVIGAEAGRQDYPQLIRVVAVRTGKYYGLPMKAGRLYTIAGARTHGTWASGVPALKAIINPSSVTLDSSGDVLLADDQSGRVRAIAASSGTRFGQHLTAGDIYTIAGGGTTLRTGGPARQAEIFATGLAIDPSGNVLIADDSTRARAVGSAVLVVADRTGKFYGQNMTAQHIYLIAGGRQPADTGDGGPAWRAALDKPSSVALWPGHGIVVAEDLKVRLISGPG